MLLGEFTCLLRIEMCVHADDSVAEIICQTSLSDFLVATRPAYLPEGTAALFRAVILHAVWIYSNGESSSASSEFRRDLSRCYGTSWTIRGTIVDWKREKRSVIGNTVSAGSCPKSGGLISVVGFLLSRTFYHSALFSWYASSHAGS